MHFSSLVSLVGLAACAVAEGPQVHLSYSSYEGTTYSNGVNAFLGMRYAAAPIGDNRLRRPRDPVAQKGLIAAKNVRGSPILPSKIV